MSLKIYLHLDLNFPNDKWLIYSLSLRNFYAFYMSTAGFRGTDYLFIIYIILLLSLYIQWNSKSFPPLMQSCPNSIWSLSVEFFWFEWCSSILFLNWTQSVHFIEGLLHTNLPDEGSTPIVIKGFCVHGRRGGIHSLYSPFWQHSEEERPSAALEWLWAFYHLRHAWHLREEELSGVIYGRYYSLLWH